MANETKTIEVGKLYWNGTLPCSAPVKVLSVEGDKATIQYAGEFLAGLSRQIAISQLYPGDESRTERPDTMSAAPETIYFEPRTAAESWEELVSRGIARKLRLSARAQRAVR
jgi:hypothetical protein